MCVDICASLHNKSSILSEIHCKYCSRKENWIHSLAGQFELIYIKKPFNSQ